MNLVKRLLMGFVLILVVMAFFIPIILIASISPELARKIESTLNLIKDALEEKIEKLKGASS